VAARYRRFEDAVDRNTRRGGPLRRTANRCLRASARTIIGARPLSTQEAVTEGYRQILRALARVEDTDVVVVAYPLPPEDGPAVYRDRANPQRQRKFVADVAAEAAAHHYRMVTNDEWLPGAAGAPVFTPDKFHLGPLGHQLLGQAVGAAILALHPATVQAPGRH
jgi:hypothetical protein